MWQHETGGNCRQLGYGHPLASSETASKYAGTQQAERAFGEHPERLLPLLACLAGYVRTDMTGGAGLIDKDECVSGLISVLESGQPLNGRWFGFDGKEIPW